MSPAVEESQRESLADADETTATSLDCTNAKRNGDSTGMLSSRGTLGHAWRTLGRSPAWSIICVGIVVLAVSVPLSLVHWPQPSVHDEFSYLLAADTYAHGRLANPAHPLGNFFESFHIIQQPTYASKYPPGQGLILALGQVLIGTPTAGLWISMTLAAMALVWMLRGWLPGRWAMLGGLIFALHTNIQLAWGHSYWGGAVAFTGGALLFGALPRLLKRPSVLVSLAMASGAILLATTRPYEGFIACSAVGLMLLWNQVRRRPVSWQTFTLRVVLPAGCLLACGIAGIGMFNQAVTGSPLKMPYAVHEAIYGSSPLFVGQAAKPFPEYQHESMEAFHKGWGLDAWREHQTLSGFLQAKLDGAARLWSFFFGALLTVPLVAAPQVLHDRGLRIVWFLLGLLYFASIMVLWTLPHYFAPAAPLLFLVLVQALRHVRASAKRAWPMAKQAPILLLGAQFVLLMLATLTLAVDPPATWAEARASLLHDLEQQPGEHLVLVSYGPNHNVHADWVYNGADLEHGKVLWARSISDTQDEPLLAHYRNRTIWRLNPDQVPLRLERVQATQDQDPFADER